MEVKYNKKQMDSLRYLFETMDIDKDGYIDPYELQSAMGSSIGVAEIETMMKQFDKDSNGVIDFDEFVIGMGPLVVEELDTGNEIIVKEEKEEDDDLNDMYSQIFGTKKKEEEKPVIIHHHEEKEEVKLTASQEETLRRIFYRIDLDGNGSIDFNEFSAALRANTRKWVSDRDIENLMKQWDKDENDCIDLEEFMKGMGNHFGHNHPRGCSEAVLFEKQKTEFF